ncbi:MAG: 2-oxoglutarate dehydrogenase complex dihydrolipoyllysine-residue succinyltransferase [Bdellovibrionota bacterium]
MKTQIKIPTVGESITEATISQWMKKNGDMVKRDEVLLMLETDKASVEVVAETAGKLSIAVNEGQTVAIGSVVGEIDSDGVGATASAPAASADVKPAPKPQAPPIPAKGAAPAAAAASGGDKPLSPAVKKLVTENSINTAAVQGTGKDGRLTKGDVLGVMNRGEAQAPAAAAAAPALKVSTPTPLPKAKTQGGGNETTREPMTKIRQTIAKRLVEAQHNAAILTTFNEIDMTNVMALRSKYKDSFEKKHGIKLGFMGFFVKACIEALKAYPKVNAYIEGTDLIYHHYYNIGMAVGTEKGLLVPIIKNAEALSLAEVEMSIKHYADKARDGKISLDDLNNGTFTISNGGVYGSLMSTPILNPPQSGILGLHKIEERPIAVAGKVEIRPMMYVALSYDHRVIDGAQSVGFLVKVKECMEDPARILLEI